MNNLTLFVYMMRTYKKLPILNEKASFFFTGMLVSLFVNLPMKADDNFVDGRQYVDLGLPSRTLWATCNIGATTPLSYGDYFAWGEVKAKPKTDYTVAKYKYNKGGERPTPKRPAVVSPQNYTWNLTKYNYKTDKKRTLDDSDDAAMAIWGKNWMMPTKEQFDELHTKCKWTYGYINNVFCWKVTGVNGNYILLPLPGDYAVIPGDRVSKNISGNEKAWYWSRNLSDNDDVYVTCLLLTKDGTSSVTTNSRVRGCSVRPVIIKEVSDSIAESKSESLMQLMKKMKDTAEDGKSAYFPFSVSTYYLSHSRDENNHEKLFTEIMKSYPNLKYSKVLNDAATSGDTDALFLLGYCYFRGLGVDISTDESRKCFMSAAEKGDNRSAVMLFTLELADQYNKPCMELLAKACLGKYPPAIVMNSILESRLKELSYLNKSQRDVLEMNIKSCVEKQYAEAEYIYGEYCENLKYLELAAEHGYIYAASRAATKLLQQQEYSRALYFAKISRKDPNYSIQGYELRQIQLYCDDPKEIAAGMYQAYLDQIYNEVETAYSKAKTKNLVTADIEVIMALRIRAKGDMANCSLANKTLAEYAEQGNVLAQEELALSYEKGWGMSSPDMTTAFSWYRKAAQKGSKKAQNYLKNKKLSW